jgi:integrase/recombinase XerD
MKPPVSLTEDELLRVLAIARSRRLRDWVLLLVTYRHGLRASEALNIRRRDLDGNFLRVYRGKGSEETEQPLQGHENPLLDEVTAVRTWLAEMGTRGVKGAAKPEGRRRVAKTLQSSQIVKFSPPGDDERLFLITRQRYAQLFREMAIEAGLPRRKRHVHCLKHSRAKHMIMSGIPAPVVRRWMGWKSMRTVDIYTQADDEESARMVLARDRASDAFRQLRQANLFSEPEPVAATPEIAPPRAARKPQRSAAAEIPPASQAGD